MDKSPITRKPSGMTPQDIQNAIADKGLNQAAIARAIGLSTVTVSGVIRGKTVSRRVHIAIAEAIGRDVKEIWPDLYLHGEPKRGRRQIDWDRSAA